MTPPPCLVWLPADHRQLGPHATPYLLLGDKYARAVKVGAQAQPVMFPLADAAQVVAGYALLGEGSFKAFSAMIASFGAPLKGDYDLALALGKYELDRHAA